MQEKSLIAKIKEGILKSGFPLELEVGSILEKHEWNYSIGNFFEDFETGKIRESDIIANKTINGIRVKLFIECKKSDDKQIVLYAPKVKPKHHNFIMRSNLKLFPRIDPLTLKLTQVLKEFDLLRSFDLSIPLSNNIIIMKGNTVAQDNVQYLNSINALVKNSVTSGSDGLIETNFRMIFIHILVFDGPLFQLTSSKTEKFDLKEIEYGQYEFKHHFKFDEKYQLDSDIVQTAMKFGLRSVIEIMTPKEFTRYVNELEAKISIIETENLKGWGKPWPETRS